MSWQKSTLKLYFFNFEILYPQHHSYRSFLGLTCLMQISTRDEDFIIDTLQLRGEMYILNETFTDPAIVKVIFRMNKFREPTKCTLVNARYCL